MNLTKQVYIDSMHGGYISTLENELTGYSEIQGRQNGLRNKPINELELKAYIMNLIESKVQSAIDHNQQINLPISGMAIARKIESEAKEKIYALQSALEDDEHKIHKLVEEKKRVIPDLQKRKLRLCVYIGTAIISITEAYFAYEAFRQASWPKIAAFFAALGIAIGVGFGTHVVAGYILKAQTINQKILRYSIVLIPAFIGFYAIGNLRADAYNSIVNLKNGVEIEVPLSPAEVSGMSITIISYLLFSIALLFSIRFYKTDDECFQDQEYDRLCGEIDKLKSQMRNKRMLIQNIQIETNEKVANAFKHFEYAIAAEKRLQSLAKHSLEVYKEANLRHRTDGLCPAFFSYPPSFNFRLFFDNLKSQKYEKDNVRPDSSMRYFI
jgi:hypothetical protein